MGKNVLLKTDCGYTSMELPRRANIHVRHIYPSFAIKVVYKGCIWAATQENQYLGFLTISDTNQDVLSQKKARSLDISRRRIVIFL